MTANPEVTDIKDGASMNRLILRVTPLLAGGEQAGGATRDLVIAEGIDGSPEGRALGSVGDLRFRRDVPQIWQKATGIRTRTGWALIAGASGECPTNVVSVGPDCAFETIQPAIDFAAALAATLQRFVVVQVAPGTYTEDLLLRPNVEVEGIGQRIPVLIVGTATFENTAGAVFLRDIRLVAGLVTENALEMGGTAAISAILERVLVDGKFVITNSGASVIVMDRCSMTVPDDGGLTIAITMSGASSTLAISYSDIMVADRATNRSISVTAGNIAITHSNIEGLVAAANAAVTINMFCVKIDTLTQACLSIGTAATVIANLCDLDSTDAAGDVVDGDGTLEFSNLSLSGTAKDFTGGTIIDQSEAYDEAEAADWNNNVPLTVKVALDRIAKFSGPIT